MSLIAITGGATGTGTFSVVAPSTSTNRTLTLPDSTGTMATAESTLAQFNATGAAPVYACRAWVNFNGTGTVAIRASGNVSSITDNGVGDYTVNFSVAIVDADYSVTATASNGGTGGACIANQNWDRAAPSTSSCPILVKNDGNFAVDEQVICVSVVR